MPRSIVRQPPRGSFGAPLGPSRVHTLWGILVWATFLTSPGLAPVNAVEPNTAGILRSASTTRLRKLDEGNDRGQDTDNSWSPTTRQPRGVTSGPGGYNPGRIKAFWRHYHGARPQPKEKPQQKQIQD